jgi:tetratricopeptide (TPR) repeat protein
MSKRVATLALALVLIAARARAAAPSEADKAEARRHFDAGVANSKLGHYGDAITEFTRAYELAPSPTPLYNIAVAHAEYGQPLEAVEMFRRYLAEGGDKIPAERRARVQARIAQLEAKLGTIRLHVAPDTAKASLDGKPVDLAAAARGIRALPGSHVVQATGEGREPHEELVEVDEGTVADLTFTLAPLPPPRPKGPIYSPPPADVAMTAPPAPPPPGPAIQQPPASPAPPERRAGATARTIGYVLAAAGVTALITGGAFYAKALSDRQKAIDAGCNSVSCGGDGATHWKDAQDGVTRARIAVIAGGVLVAGGLTLVLIAPATRDAPAAVMLGGRF